MASVTAKAMTFRPGDVSKAVRAGETVELTFHGHTYGAVVPIDQWRAAQAALEREQAHEQRREADTAT